MGGTLDNAHSHRNLRPGCRCEEAARNRRCKAQSDQGLFLSVRSWSVDRDTPAIADPGPHVAVAQLSQQRLGPTAHLRDDLIHDLEVSKRIPLTNAVCHRNSA